jgi:hypothetical protein
MGMPSISTFRVRHRKYAGSMTSVVLPEPVGPIARLLRRNAEVMHAKPVWSCGEAQVPALDFTLYLYRRERLIVLLVRMLAALTASVSQSRAAQPESH